MESRGTYRYNPAGDVDDGRSLAAMDKYLVSNPLFDYCMTGDNLLDVGCGNGRMWKLLHGRFKQIVGIDPFVDLNPSFVYPNCRYEKVSFEDFQIGEKFDVVLFNQSFYLMYNKMVKFEKATKLLKPKGTFILIDDICRDDMDRHNTTPDTFYSIERLCWRFKLNRVLEIVASKTRFTALERV